MAARYVDPADLLVILPAYLRLQLLDDDRDGTEESGLASEIVDQAANEVDSAFDTAGYSVPFATAPPMAVTLTLNGARYWAHYRLSATNADIERQRERDLATLDKIASRKLLPGIDPQPPESTEALSGPEFVGPERVFSRSTLAVF